MGRPSPISYSAMTIAILGWGLSTTFIEFGLDLIAPLPFLFYRFGLATIALTPLVILFRRSQFLELIGNKWTWIIGISESLGLTLQYLGQELDVTAGLAALLSLCFIVIVPFISPFILNEKLEKNHLIAMSVAFIGVIFISSEGNVNNLTGSSILGIIFLLWCSSWLCILHHVNLKINDHRKTRCRYFYSFLLCITDYIAFKSFCFTCLQ